MRLVVTTDIHGCLEEFDELLALVEFDRTRDRLIIAGDLVDRGPDSVGVVRRARELNAVCVLGNHEQKHLAYRRDLLTKGSSAKQMGSQKLAIQAALNDEDWRFLEAFPLYYYVNPTLVVIHAGLEPGCAVETQKPNVLTMMRYLWRKEGKMISARYRDGDLLHPDTAAFWTDCWDGAESVIYGHHVQLDGRVAIDHKENGAVCYGLDTGACFGKQLSALIFKSTVDTEPEVVAVKAKAVYTALLSHRTVAESEFRAAK